MPSRYPSARELAVALDGRKSGRGWTTKCPAHDDRTPSLSICERGGKVLVKCWAGCSQQEVIAALRARGLWSGRDRQVRWQPKRSNPRTEKSDASAAERVERALLPWRDAQPLHGTLAETYQASRGINLLAVHSLRFHPRLWHWPSQSDWPAIVALVTNAASGKPLGTHQTFLARDGRGKAPVDKPRLFAGPIGGGGVWFGEAGPDNELIVAEGVETTLSAMRLYGAAAGVAALSASGMKALALPPWAQRVRIVADNDTNGIGQSAARTAYRRWTAEGRAVRVALPKATGADANDALMRGLGLKP